MVLSQTDRNFCLTLPPSDLCVDVVSMCAQDVQKVQTRFIHHVKYQNTSLLGLWLMLQSNGNIKFSQFQRKCKISIYYTEMIKILPLQV